VVEILFSLLICPAASSLVASNGKANGDANSWRRG
jgi:hypothetical protein